MGGAHRGLDLNIVGRKPVVFLGDVLLKELPDPVSQFFEIFLLTWSEPVFGGFRRLIQPSDYERSSRP